MIPLPLLAALAAPISESSAQDDEPHICKVEWSAEHDDEMYRDLAEVALLQRCDNLLIALNYEAERDSVVIELKAEPNFLETFESEISITLPGEEAQGPSTFAPEASCPCPSVVSLANFTLQQLAEAVEESRKTTPPPPSDPPLVHEDPPPHKPRLRALGWTGIGLASAGLVAGVTGAVLFSFREDETAFGSENNQRVEEGFRYRNPAIGLSVGGGVLLGAGLAMLFVDLRRSKDAPSTTFAPSLSPEGAGFSLLGRF